MSDNERNEKSNAPRGDHNNNNNSGGNSGGGQQRGNYQGGGGRYNRNNDNRQGGRKKMYFRRKVCRFCADKSLKIDYKESDILRRFVTEGGKIIPKRISGNCSKHQRLLSKEIKKARAIALLPYLKK